MLKWEKVISVVDQEEFIESNGLLFKLLDVGPPLVASQYPVAGPASQDDRDITQLSNCVTKLCHAWLHCLCIERRNMIQPEN